MQDKVYHTPNKKSNNECPTCGWEIEQSHTFENMLSGQFTNEKNGDYSAFRTTPIRQPSIECDVLVPFAQSLITSVEAVLLAVPVVIWLGTKPTVLLFIWAGVLLLFWISALKRAQLSQSKVEEFSYVANDVQRGQFGAVSETAPVHLEVVHEQSGLRNRMQLMDLPSQISEPDFVTFLRDLLLGKSIARKNWVGPGKLFSRDGYDGMMDKLVSASIVTSGVSGKKMLSNGGKRAIARMLDEGEIWP